MPDLSLMIFAAAVVAFAASVQGTLGFGFAAVSIPLLTLLDPLLTPVPVIMLALLLSTATMVREHQAINFTGLQWILVARVIGSFLGIWILATISERSLGIAIGLFVLLAATVIGFGLSVPRRPATEVPVGLVSGIGGIVAGIGGPPLALLFQRDAAPTVRSTLATIFFVGQLVNVVALWATGTMTPLDRSIAARLIIPLVIGFLASSWLRHHINEQLFRRGVIALAATSAFAVLVQAIS